MLSHSETINYHNLSKEFSTLAKGTSSDVSSATDRSRTSQSQNEVPGLTKPEAATTHCAHGLGVPKLLLTFFFGNIFLGNAFKPWLLKGLLQPLPSYDIFSSLVHESNPCLPSHLQGYYENSYTEILGTMREPRRDVEEITSSIAQTQVPSPVTSVEPPEETGGR